MGYTLAPVTMGGQQKTLRTSARGTTMHQVKVIESDAVELELSGGEQGNSQQLRYDRKVSNPCSECRCDFSQSLQCTIACVYSKLFIPMYNDSAAALYMVPRSSISTIISTRQLPPGAINHPRSRGGFKAWSGVTKPYGLYQS